MTRRAGIDPEIVVNCAARIADNKGLEALSLSALAQELDVRTPSLYNHVAGLPELRRQLALKGTRDLRDTMTQAAVGKSGDEAVIAMSTAYRDYVKAHPGVYAASVRAADPDDTELQAAEQEVVDVVLKTISAYDLRGDDAIHVVRGLRSVIHGFASLEVAGGFGLPQSTGESFTRLLRIFLDGLHASTTR